MQDKFLERFFAFVFLIIAGIYGAYLLIDPRGWGRKMERISEGLPILKYTKSKSGLLQLRLVGLMFVIASCGMLIVLLRLVFGG